MAIQNIANNIGIIGAGHLGRALAKCFIAAGVPAAGIRISFSGSTHTFSLLQQQGLAQMVCSSQAVAKQSDVIFIAVRPGSITSLADIAFNKQATIVSCMAGCPTGLLEKTLRHEVYRIMPSSPVTIENSSAVCAIYPQNKGLAHLLTSAGFVLYPLAEENLFDIFTACVCLPAAFLQLQVAGANYNNDEAVKHFSQQFAPFGQLFHWANTLTPLNLSLQNKLDYIHRMATPGGITEAMVNSIKNGDGLITALEKGIARSGEIAARIT
jgi:pyrroline-5-carboxylate reductase